MYKVGLGSSSLLKVSLVTTAAMLAICLLALVEMPHTSEAASLPQNGKIAFSRHQGVGSDLRSDLYTVDPDGSNLSQLTDTSSADYPAWSPDGTKIAFIASGFPIWVMGAGGSNLRMLTHNRSGYPSNPAPTWSPDGEHLALVTRESPKQSNLDIYTMGLDSSNKTNITNSPKVFEDYIDFSPDGSQMCVHRPGTMQVEGGIYVMSADASNPTRVTDSRTWACAWSPDGTKIAYQRYDSYRSDDSEVYVMNTDGSGKTNLTSNPAWDGNPEWAPDGTRIAFASNRDGDIDVYTMDADGSDVAQVTKNTGVDDYQPDWQPLTPESRSMTVHPPDTGGPSLLLVASVLLFSGGVLFYAAVKRRM